ncbi:uncharacterized protein BDW43DRAFT_313680 [Aspergillus alliaceus]|uniref:uncharacterized protein n=1 Tax=Petromyces alliaceus TaxID=209559 RepID=UPI0012A6F109|nr:uncharacterized protein BDW43DRAFT_313680 [Aspergillus alliaceus]KAB8230880.1 hypothetical protein BDW43DRAFT_313680 [Aspergillus alliaceus]
MALDSPLLRLPPALRNRIYLDTDIPHRTCFNPELVAQSALIIEERRTMRSLLLTCRTVHHEVSSIVYGTNRLYLSYQQSDSFQFLFNLTPRSLQHITDLTVFLSVFPPDDDEHCHEISGCWHGPFPSIWNLESGDQQGRAALTEWEAVVEHVAPHIKPLTLRLNFICDVGDVETARAAIRPLYNLPVLSDCNIRLSSDPDARLQKVARDTVFEMTGRHVPSPSCAFRFMDLPVELRLQVLEHTDLVTPLREVEWNPQNNFCLRYYERQCTNCGCTLQKPYRNCWQYLKSGCFCHRYHAAFSKHCKCWTPPTSLFLVSRTVKYEAQTVFFSKNRFIIMPPGGLFPTEEGLNSKLPPAVFLTKIVPSHALPCLRFLEIYFSPLDVDGFSSESAMYRDWERVIRELGDNLNYQNLTVRLWFGDYVHGGQAIESNRAIGDEEGQEVLSKYFALVKPFINFRRRGLQRFFVHAAWPWNWTPTGYMKRMRKPELVYNRVQKINQKLERRVMGNSYDSASLGKQLIQWSQWREVLEEMLVDEEAIFFD